MSKGPYIFEDSSNIHGRCQDLYSYSYKGLDHGCCIGFLGLIKWTPTSLGIFIYGDLRRSKIDYPYHRQRDALLVSQEDDKSQYHVSYGGIKEDTSCTVAIGIFQYAFDLHGSV